MLPAVTNQEIIVAIIVMFVLEAIVPWNLTSGYYKDLIQSVQGSPMKIRYDYMLITYVTLIVYIYFIALPLAKISMWYPFLLGVLLYGFTNFSNLALLSGYKLLAGLIDIIWGGVLVWGICWITLRVIKPSQKI